MASSKSRTIVSASAESTRTILHTRLEDEAKVRAEYEFGNKLGQGSFGVVLEATSLKDGGKWAVKIISKDIKEKDRSTAFKLLEREVAILKKVRHEHIIHLEEVFETSKKMYLIMELCKGGELADALKEKQKFSEDETKIVIRKLASAIQYLHKNDVVHRDLKLENILLTHNPQDPDDHLHIKVTDFGLSVVKDGVGYDSMMQAVCGTPVYMSPEIIDNKTYSQQCDVWAMGIIMYTLLSGSPPFLGDDEEKLYAVIKRGEINFPEEHFRDLTDEAKNCICGMLKVDPAHRYTASEVLDHSWISGQELADRPMNVLEMMKQWKHLNMDSDSLEPCDLDSELTSNVNECSTNDDQEEVEKTKGSLSRIEVRNGVSGADSCKASSSNDNYHNNNHKMADKNLLRAPSSSNSSSSSTRSSKTSKPLNQPNSSSPHINRKTMTSSSSTTAGGATSASSSSPGKNSTRAKKK